MMKQKEEILYAIKEVIAQVMPTGARVVLLGSKVRNDAREDSDILILLDKEKLEEACNRIEKELKEREKNSNQIIQSKLEKEYEYAQKF